MLESTKKPDHGYIRDWYKVPCTSGLKYRIGGIFLNHPTLSEGITSTVIKHEGNKDETKNSRYTLVGEERQ